MRALRARNFDHTPSRKVAYFERAKDCFCQKKEEDLPLQAKFWASTEAMNINLCLGFAVLHADSTASTVMSVW